MVRYVNVDTDNRVYYTIMCDQCRQPFICYDDACYHYPHLRASAVFSGWDAGGPDQPHHCPECTRGRSETTRNTACADMVTAAGEEGDIPGAWAAATTIRHRSATSSPGSDRARDQPRLPGPVAVRRHSRRAAASDWFLCVW
jgi:hypothetical protein